jgi:hypothetical protein
MGDVGGTQHATRAGQEPEVRHRGLGQAALGLFCRFFEQILKSHGRIGEAEQEMLVGGSEIHVGDHHVMTILRQHGREVERNDALAHPAFASTDGNDA